MVLQLDAVVNEVPLKRVVVLIRRPEPKEGAVDVHVVPLDVKTLPEVPGATNCTALVPLPRITLFAVRVLAPVPPFATATVPVTLAALPPMLRDAAVPVRSVPGPVNWVEAVIVVPPRVVNVPAAAVVPPIAGGEAKYVLNPVPDTVLDADNVVNEPAAAVVPPIAGGEAR